MVKLLLQYGHIGDTLLYLHNYLFDLFLFHSAAVHEQPVFTASGKRSGTSYEHKVRQAATNTKFNITVANNNYNNDNNCDLNYLSETSDGNRTER